MDTFLLFFWGREDKSSHSVLTLTIKAWSRSRWVQQIICSRSFGHRITQYSDMYQAGCAYAERAAEKLQAGRKRCCVISVFIRASPHDENKTFYNPQASGRLTIPKRHRLVCRSGHSKKLGHKARDAIAGLYNTLRWFTDRQIKTLSIYLYRRSFNLFI